MGALQVVAQAQLRRLFASSTTRSFQTKSIQAFTRPTFRTRPTHQFVRHAHSAPKRPGTSPFAQLRSRVTRRWKSEDALDSIPEAKLSLSQRLKKMSRDYGWTAVYLYFALSALDFPFCFLAVKWLGTDTIGHWEHVIVSYVKDFVPWLASGESASVESAVDTAKDVAQSSTDKRLLEEDVGGDVTDHGYKEALEANSGKDASLGTQLALAYAIHKSFIFIRVPLTAALLPKVVKTLRGWGWNIGRPSTKAIQNAASKKSASKSGVNTKGSGVKPDD